jgi:peptide deformylase
MFEASGHIFCILDKKEEKFLRTKTKDVPLAELKNKETVKELRKALDDMRRLMVKAEGVGLSANQAGMPYRFFIARTMDRNGKWKHYAVINPRIVKKSKETATSEEGCLSIPFTFGPVERPAEVTIEYVNVLGKPQKTAARGLLARICQHEIDHLDGVLFTDRAKYVEDIRDAQKGTSI